MAGLSIPGYNRWMCGKVWRAQPEYPRERPADLAHNGCTAAVSWRDMRLLVPALSHDPPANPEAVGNIPCQSPQKITVWLLTLYAIL